MNFEELILKSGSHSSRESGMCAMEAVAWLNKEPHSDKPECACPAMTAAFQRLNDSGDWESDEERTRYLKPLLPKLIGTRDAQSKARAKFLAHHALSWAAPFALDKASEVFALKGYPEHSASLKAHSEKLRAEPTQENALKAEYAAFTAAYDAGGAKTANAAEAAKTASYAYATCTAAKTANAAAKTAADAAYADSTADLADHAADLADDLAANSAAYAADSAAHAAADAADATARREVLFERIRVLTECLDKFPAKSGD